MNCGNSCGGTRLCPDPAIPQISWVNWLITIFKIPSMEKKEHLANLNGNRGACKRPPLERLMQRPCGCMRHGRCDITIKNGTGHREIMPAGVADCTVYAGPLPTHYRFGCSKPGARVRPLLTTKNRRAAELWASKDPNAHRDVAITSCDCW